MKWTIALLGALLSLAGFYALYSGLSIIQVERGWATFIAGAIFLGSGVIVLGVAALMGRIDNLADLYEETLALAEERAAEASAAESTSERAAGLSAAVAAPPAFAPPAYDAPPAPTDAPSAPYEAPQAAYEPAPAPYQPPPRVVTWRDAPAVRQQPVEAAPEPPRWSPPSPQAAFAPVEPEPAALAQALEPAEPPRPEAQTFEAPPAEPEPAVEARPAGLRDFTFVFPPPEPILEQTPDVADEPQPQAAPAAERSDPPAPIEPARAPPGLGWLRRAKPEASSPATLPPTSARRPFDDPQQTSDSPNQPSEPMPMPALSSPPGFEPPALAPIAAEPPQPESEIAEARAPGVQEAAKAPEPAADPFSDDWLERALADANEASTQAPTQPAMRRPPPLPDAPQVERVADATSDPAATGPDLAAEQGEPQQATPQDAEEPSRTPQANGAPVEIGRYRANNVAYIMFSDGSITAETPAGNSYRFNSLLELRAFIERGDI